MPEVKHTSLITVENKDKEKSTLPTSEQASLVHEIRIREYLVRIEALTTQISLLQKKAEPLEKKCQEFQMEVTFKMRSLERQDQICNTKLLMFEELQVEYSQIIAEAEYKKRYTQKKQLIDAALEEISQTEQDLLQIELQRINAEISLQPILDEISLLEAERKNLILQKEQYAQTYLHHMQRLALENNTLD